LCWSDETVNGNYLEYRTVEISTTRKGSRRVQRSLKSSCELLDSEICTPSVPSVRGVTLSYE